jgi:hypothetical protein
MTVALGLLAFKIAGDREGAVLGTALAIKMVAYVGIAPVAGSLAGYVPRWPRRPPTISRQWDLQKRKSKFS